MKLVVSERAEKDLDDIYDYLYALNAKAARDQAADISEKFKQLIRFPFIGRDRSGFGAGMRSVVSGTKVIFYLVDDGQIHVVRVLDGRMDLDKELQGIA